MDQKFNFILFLFPPPTNIYQDFARNPKNTQNCGLA